MKRSPYPRTGRHFLRIRQLQKKYLRPGVRRQLKSVEEEGRRATPEEVLLAAMIRITYFDIWRKPTWDEKKNRHTRKRDTIEATVWVRSEQRHPFTFLWVCDKLRIDPASTRHMLLNIPSVGEGRKNCWRGLFD